MAKSTWEEPTCQHKNQEANIQPVRTTLLTLPRRSACCASSVRLSPSLPKLALMRLKQPWSVAVNSRTKMQSLSGGILALPLNHQRSPSAAASDGAAKALAKARSGTRREELWAEQLIEDDVEFPASWSDRDRHGESSRQSRCYIDQPNRGLETRGGSARTTSKCQANQSRLNLRPNNPKFLLHGATLRPRSQRKNW